MVWKIKGKGNAVIKVFEDFYGNLWFATEEYKDNIGKENELYFGYVRLYNMPEFAEWGDFSIKEVREAVGKNKVWEVQKKNWSNINTYEKDLLNEVGNENKI